MSDCQVVRVKMNKSINFTSQTIALPSFFSAIHFLPSAVGVSVQVNVCFCVFFPSLSVIMLMSSRHKISSPLGKVAIVGSKCRPVENSSVCAPVLVYKTAKYFQATNLG